MHCWFDPRVDRGMRAFDSFRTFLFTHWCSCIPFLIAFLSALKRTQFLRLCLNVSLSHPSYTSFFYFSLSAWCTTFWGCWQRKSFLSEKLIRWPPIFFRFPRKVGHKGSVYKKSAMVVGLLFEINCKTQTQDVTDSNGASRHQTDYFQPQST